MSALDHYWVIRSAWTVGSGSTLRKVWDILWEIFWSAVLHIMIYLQVTYDSNTERGNQHAKM